MTDVQETIAEALVRPGEPRVWAHVGCGGWVLWSLLERGKCIRCGAGPLHPGEYEKPARDG